MVLVSGPHHLHQHLAAGHRLVPQQHLDTPVQQQQGGGGAVTLELETSASNEGYPKVRNHGEGTYKGLLLVESGYYRFHI